MPKVWLAVINPRKTTWCNGCYLDVLREMYEDQLVLVPAASSVFPKAVEAYVLDIEPAEGQRIEEHEGRSVRLAAHFRSPLHCNDGGCKIWLEKHGEPGRAWHMAFELELLDAAHKESCRCAGVVSEAELASLVVDSQSVRRAEAECEQGDIPPKPFSTSTHTLKEKRS